MLFFIPDKIHRMPNCFLHSKVSNFINIYLKMNFKIFNCLYSIAKMSLTFATQRRFLTEILTSTVENGQERDIEMTSTSKRRKRQITVDVDQDKFRKIVITSKPLKGSAGSANVEMGNTRVSCAVTGPKEQQSAESPLEGVLNISLYGSIDPTARYALEHALKAVICLKKLGRTEIEIELHVLSDDGGALAACLMAASVAIASANIEMSDILLACNVLIPSEQQNQQEESPPQPMLVILDPDQATISALAGKATTLTMAITPSNGQVVSTEFGGGCPLPLSIVRHVLPLVFDYCIALYPIVRKAMLKNIVENEEKERRRT